MRSNCTFRLAEANDRELRVEFISAGHSTPVNFRLLEPTPPDISLSWSPEAQAAAGLIPAMRSGVPLQIEGLLEPTFQRNLGTVQDILGLWCQNLRKVAVVADAAAVPANSPANLPATRQALFFGGGVDSMFSLVRFANEITDLIYVHGFDVPLTETELRHSISVYLREVANLFGVNLIEMETDFRPILDTHVSWSYSHGTALGAVAHLFRRHFSRVYISSSYSYANLIPWGSHPLLDPLWSISSLEVVHDGADVSRADKVAVIAKNAAARRWLRVCWVAPRAARLNCCRCEKCLRTMVALKAVGELHPDEAFNLPLELSKVRAVALNERNRTFWRENYELLINTGRDPKLLAVVDRLLEPNPFRRWRQQFRAWNMQRRLARRKSKQERTRTSDEQR